MSERVVDLTGVRSKAVEKLADCDALVSLWGLPVREKIVRCKDCKHYKDHEWVILTDVSDVCHFWGGGSVKVEPDGFCKWGERRAGDAE